MTLPLRGDSPFGVAGSYFQFYSQPPDTRPDQVSKTALLLQVKDVQRTRFVREGERPVSPELQGTAGRVSFQGIEIVSRLACYASHASVPSCCSSLWLLYSSLNLFIVDENRILSQLSTVILSSLRYRVGLSLFVIYSRIGQEH